ncbi:UbiD family decarboxylase [Chloroflexota bacterium]
MAFGDIREFIDTLKQTGDLVTIEQEVDWDLEAGAINRRAYEMNGPAILFENIKDYPKGYRIMAGAFGSFRRLAIAMGLPPDTSIKDLHTKYEQRNEPIKPVVVDSGPCKENIILGDDVDIYRFPAPMIHEGDGGRYIGTWGIAVSKDPDSNWMNWGVYRFMVHNRRFLLGSTRPQSHIGMTLVEKCMSKNQPLPIALVIGAEPLCHLAAATSYPPGVDEVDFAGGLRLEPEVLTKCETSDLLVPASAEIVIEGEILPDKTAEEGPFGEYSGYRSPSQSTGMLCEIKAITFRHDPILTMISAGVPDDHSPVIAITSATAIKRALLRREIPVTGVHILPQSGLHIAIIGVESGGKDVAQRILEALSRRNAMMSKIIIVDKDVDVFNFDQVIHAVGVKCHPVNGIQTKTLAPSAGNTTTPCFSLEERMARTGAMAVLDCTWPPDWPRDITPVRSSFDDTYPEEIKRKVVANWHSYGL